MKSDPKMTEQEKPSKKNLLQKIKGFISNALERKASEEGKWKDLDDW